MHLLAALLVPILSINAQVTIANEKMNILYVGLKNPISVAAFNLDCEDIEIVAADCDIQKADRRCDKFMLTPKKPPQVKISIFKLIPEGRELLSEQMFQVKHPPLPDEVYMVALEPGELDPETGECCVNLRFQNLEKASIAQLQNARGLGLAVHNFNFDIRYVYTRYNYSIMRNGENIVTERVIDNQFSEKWKDHLKSIQADDQIVFHDIYVRYYQDEIQLDDITIIVK